MKALIIMSVVLGSVVWPFLLIWMIKASYRKHYNKNKHKISDAEIFKLMARTSHFLSHEQLAAVSPLTEKEASTHLMYLSFEGALKRYQDSNGVKSIYQLKEALPEDDVLPVSIQGLSDQQVVDQILLYSEDYQVTLAELCVVFGLDVEDAQITLNRLKKSGLVSTLWRGFSRIHVINDPLTKKTPKLDIPIQEQQESVSKLAIPSQEKIKIPDADVLNLAIAQKGRLTATVLCVKLKIPIVQAQQKLDDLYEQGVFTMQVDDANAVLEYELRDKNLLS